MFCDLVGSTELASRLDLEDLREVYAAYHRAVADVVKSFDGFVAKYMGECSCNSRPKPRPCRDANHLPKLGDFRTISGTASVPETSGYVTTKYHRETG
jgi:class 3 adenylate cyclase